MNHASEPGASPYLSPGHVLRNRYEIEREIGRGGYSVVYLARDRELDTNVAVKLLVPPPALAALARERMRREAIAVRGLSHPTIVSLHDFLEDDGRSYLVMEYVDGPDLWERVDAGGVLSPEEAVRVGTNIAAALDTAHGKGILHRDVKPQNVLLSPEGGARLTDFGSARLESQTTVTATGGIVGTLAYAAPEELAGQRADARSDVFSLGLTLYFALTGELPGGSSSRHLPAASAEGGYRPRSVRSEVPLWLDEVVACATSAAPAHRFPTAGSMRDTLVAASGSALESSLTFPYSEMDDGCPLCGTRDVLDLGVCPGCADGAKAADALLFVAGPSDSRDREHVADRLSHALGRTASRTELADLMSGRRPLALIPMASVDAAVARLAERLIPASFEAARGAWRRVPPSFLATLLAVLIAGLMAGRLAAPSMLLVTPLFAALLTILAVRRVRTPVLRPARGARLRLPPGAADSVQDTLTSITPGPARRLLQDVARLAAGVYGQRGSAGGPDVEEHLSSLLNLACGVAVDLGHLDESVTILEDQEALPPGEAERAGTLESLARARRARDALTQRLLEVMAALGRTRIAQASGASAAEGLTAFAAVLERDAAADAAARREVETLTG